MGGRSKESGQSGGGGGGGSGRAQPEATPTLASLSEEGRLGEALGIDITGSTTKSAEELKEIANGFEGLSVNVDRMKNADNIAQKIMEAGYDHTFRKAQADHDWAIDTIVSTTGQHRNEILGVQKKLFSDPGQARTWYRGWTKILHPDNNQGNPRAQTAMDIVATLYSQMKR